MAVDTDATQDEQAAKDAAAAKAAEKERKAEEKRIQREQRIKEQEDAKAAKAAARAEADRKKVAQLFADAGVETPDGVEDISLKDAREQIKQLKAEQRASKPKKAPLTLSQRRALLKLAEGDVVPTTNMGATPLLYLQSVGLATSEDVNQTVTRTAPNPDYDKDVEGSPKTIESEETIKRTRFTLTDAGRERAEATNPKWRDWKPAGSGTAA